MDLKQDLKKALEELRKNKEKKFDQTVDLIVNLQKFEPKKNNINLFITVPYKIKDKKIDSYLEIGCRWGGTFIIINELLKRYNPYLYFYQTPSTCPKKRSPLRKMPPTFFCIS